MNSEGLLIYGGAIRGDPNHIRRANYLKNLGNFLWFFQRNGLTRRTVLKNKRTALLSTKLLRSDLTDEGYRVFRAAFPKWQDTIDPKAFEKATAERLTKSLLCFRKQKGQKETRSYSSFVEKARSRKRSFSPRPKSKAHPSFENFETTRADEDYESAGPHVYDKAEWHWEGDFPAGVDQDQAFVHTGMFVWWLCEHDMIGGEFLRDAKQVTLEKITGIEAYKKWGGFLTSEMLNEEGNRFAHYYYKKRFFADYEERLVSDLPTFYHVRGTRKNYLKIALTIDMRYLRSSRKAAIKSSA